MMNNEITFPLFHYFLFVKENSYRIAVLLEAGYVVSITVPPGARCFRQMMRDGELMGKVIGKN